MRSLTEKIKNSFSIATALRSPDFALGLVCFAFMFLIRYKGIFHWDDLAYLKNMIRGMPSDLLLGRPGFMYPFIWLWWVLKNFGVSFYFIEQSVRISGIFFLTGAYLFLFWLMRALQFSVRMSFLTVLFLLSEFSFSIISSRVTDSALMYLCLTASYYLFVRAHQEISFKKLLIAAALASYAFLTREPALFYFPFYLIFLLYFYRRDKLFSLKQYFAGAGLFLGLCLAVPGIMMLYYGSQYIDTLRFSSAHGYTPQLSGIVIKARYFWDAHVNLILLPVAVAGLAILWIRQGWRFVAGLISVCFVPLLIILLVSEEALMLEPRIFMGYFFVMAFGLAYLTDVVAQFIYYTYRPFAIGAACIIFTYISAVRFLPDYRADLSKIQYLENYYESIKPLINKDVVIIIGEETLYVGYRGQADGIGPYFISPGWSWPTGKLVERLNKLLSENLTVIYDPRTRHYQAAKRSKDLDEMTETFTLTETKNGFIQVTLKK